LKVPDNFERPFIELAVFGHKKGEPLPARLEFNSDAG
jgi:hypothetical protein